MQGDRASKAGRVESASSSVGVRASRVALLRLLLRFQLDLQEERPPVAASSNNNGTLRTTRARITDKVRSPSTTNTNNKELRPQPLNSSEHGRARHLRAASGKSSSPRRPTSQCEESTLPAQTQLGGSQSRRRRSQA